MPISEEDRRHQLEYLAQMREATVSNKQSVIEMKKRYPDLPDEVVMYLDLSAIAFNQVYWTMVTANEKILILDDALTREMQKNSGGNQ